MTSLCRYLENERGISKSSCSARLCALSDLHICRGAQGWWLLISTLDSNLQEPEEIRCKRNKERPYFYVAASEGAELLQNVRVVRCHIFCCHIPLYRRQHEGLTLNPSREVLEDELFDQLDVRENLEVKL